MDLLDRYLQAVEFLLPRGQQDDIIRELSENLMAQIEERQEELGRPLDESELAEILRRHGHPMLVAGRYRSWQQLIGPVFFPIYLFAMKVGLAAALLVTVVAALISAAVHGNPVEQAVRAMLDFPGRALMVFAWTTLVFAALDAAQSRLRLSPGWDPRTLPKVVRYENHIPRMRSLCELLFLVAALVWLALLPSAPFLALGPAAPLMDPAPVWRAVYMPIVLLTLAALCVSAINFARPVWTRARTVARLAINVANLLVVVFVFRAGEWFVPAATQPDGQVDRLIEIVNASLQIGLTVAIFVVMIEIVKELLRLENRRDSRTDAAPAGAAR